MKTIFNSIQHNFQGRGFFRYLTLTLILSIILHWMWNQYFAINMGWEEIKYPMVLTVSLLAVFSLKHLSKKHGSNWPK